MALADRIAVLVAGEFIQVATPEDIYLRPATVGVARLFGDPVINLVEAPIEASGGGVVAQVGGGRVALGRRQRRRCGKIGHPRRPPGSGHHRRRRLERPRRRGDGGDTAQRADRAAAQIRQRLGVSRLAAVDRQRACRRPARGSASPSPPTAPTFSTPQQASVSMAELVLSSVDKIYRPRRKAAVHAVRGARPHCRRRRDRRAARLLRLRQDLDAADDRRLRGRDQRRHHPRRPADP